MERALEVLSETCWEGAAEEAKSRRLQLCEMAGVDGGACQKASGKSSKLVGRQPTSTDENMSYSSLVGFSGF